MKKILSNGFTLIELLVVITIIAILAVTGFVVYSNVSARGRDIKRMSEIDAIQKAMEKNYQPSAVSPYPVLAVGDFVNGAVPKDPLTGTNRCGINGTQVCDYCVVASARNYQTCASVVSTSAPTGTSYTVCANLETQAGSGGNTFYCKSNAQ